MVLIHPFRSPARSWFILILTLLCGVAVSISWIVALLLSPAKAHGAQPATIPALPKPVTSFGAAVVNDHLYVLGGHVGDPHDYSKEAVSLDFLRIDLKKPVRWEKLPETRALQGLAVVGHGRHVYRLGGLEPRNSEGQEGDLHSTAEVARFDVKTSKWEGCTPLPEPRSSHDAVVVGDEVIVVGGWKMEGKGVKGAWLKTVWSADLSAWPIKWKQISETPFERRAMSVAATEGKIVAVGGIEPRGGTVASVGLLDLATGKWSEGTPFPTEHKMGGFGSSAFAIGGVVYANGWDTPLMGYDVKANQWKPSDAKLSHKRFFHRLVAHGDSTLIMLGGAGKAQQWDDVDIIQVGAKRQAAE